MNTISNPLFGVMNFKNRFDATAYLRSVSNVKYVYMLMHNDIPFYVGISTNWKRIHEHFSDNRRKINTLLRRKIRKINATSGTVQIKIINHYATYSDMYAAEKNLIRFYGKMIDKTGILTNYSDGGEGRSGLTSSLKQKDAVKKANTGKVKSPETLLKLSISMKKTMQERGGTFKGRRHSEETKKLMSENNSGVNHPQYGKPSALLGRKHTEQTVSRIKESLSKIDMSCTEDRKEKLSKYWSMQPLLTCPHCNKESTFKPSMIKHHFDNCKKKITDYVENKCQSSGL